MGKLVAGEKLTLLEVEGDDDGGLRARVALSEPPHSGEADEAIPACFTLDNTYEESMLPKSTPRTPRTPRTRALEEGGAALGSNGSTRDNTPRRTWAEDGLGSSSSTPHITPRTPRTSFAASVSRGHSSRKEQQQEGSAAAGEHASPSAFRAASSSAQRTNTAVTPSAAAAGATTAPPSCMSARGGATCASARGGGGGSALSNALVRSTGALDMRERASSASAQSEGSVRGERSALGTILGSAGCMSARTSTAGGRTPRPSEMTPLGWVTVAKQGTYNIAPRTELRAGKRQEAIVQWLRRLTADKLDQLAHRKPEWSADGTKQFDSYKPLVRHASEVFRTQERGMVRDGVGFAYGGVEPGRLHAHGNPVAIHKVYYSVAAVGRYKLHVGLRAQVTETEGS